MTIGSCGFQHRVAQGLEFFDTSFHTLRPRDSPGKAFKRDCAAVGKNDENAYFRLINRHKCSQGIIIGTQRIIYHQTPFTLNV